MEAKNFVIDHYIIEVLDGPEKGIKFKLDPGLRQVTIGRSQQCDIQLSKDPKLSRKHIALQIKSHGVILTNLSNKNEVIVNGEATQQTRLSDGTIIKVGSSKFIFTTSFSPSSQTPFPPPLNQPTMPPSQPEDFNFGNSSKQAQSNLLSLNARPQTPTGYQTPLPKLNYSSANPPNGRRRRKAKKTNKTFYLIVGTMVLLFVWVLQSSKPPSPEPLELRTPEQTEKEIEALEEKKRKHIEDLHSSGKTTREFQDAQAAFVQGFRDYQQGQYVRALEAFEMAETLYKNHPEATRYKFLTQRKLAELIQYKLDRGKKYRDRNNYKMCMAELKSVMIMVKNPQHTLYKEAKAMFDDCDLMLKGRF